MVSSPEYPPVSIPMATWDHKKRRTTKVKKAGRKLSRHFGCWRPDRASTWSITHLGTGYGIAWGATLDEAAAIAAKLERSRSRWDTSRYQEVRITRPLTRWLQRLNTKSSRVDALAEIGYPPQQ